MERIKELIIKHREIISYLFWGGMTTLVSWGSYALAELVFHSLDQKLLGVALSVYLASILSWICAVLFAFVTNKLWVFRSKSWARSVAWPEFLKFLSSRLATGVLEFVGVPLLVRIGLDYPLMGRDGLLAKIIVTIIVVILNYILSKLFIFKKETE